MFSCANRNLKFWMPFFVRFTSICQKKIGHPFCQLKFCQVKLKAFWPKTNFKVFFTVLSELKMLSQTITAQIRVSARFLPLSQWGFLNQKVPNYCVLRQNTKIKSKTKKK